MPRQAKIDTSGALQHLVIRGEIGDRHFIFDTILFLCHFEQCFIN